MNECSAWTDQTLSKSVIIDGMIKCLTLYKSIYFIHRLKQLSEHIRKYQTLEMQSVCESLKKHVVAAVKKSECINFLFCLLSFDEIFPAVKNRRPDDADVKK